MCKTKTYVKSKPNLGRPDALIKAPVILRPTTKRTRLPQTRREKRPPSNNITETQFINNNMIT